MNKFVKGEKVLKKGTHQTMEVVGDVGVDDTSGSQARISHKHMVVCQWTVANGKRISRAFAASDLLSVEK